MIKLGKEHEAMRSQSWSNKSCQVIRSCGWSNLGGNGGELGNVADGCEEARLDDRKRLFGVVGYSDSSVVVDNGPVNGVEPGS